MHGPIHHIIDGAAFMTAMYNAGVKFNLDTALDELANRGSDMPGATCGKWGMCGSASSVGAALAKQDLFQAMNITSIIYNLYQMFF